MEVIEKKETKEILANIGKKIYIPVEIKDKNLIIEVGNKKFVKKSISETKELIEEQIIKLNSARQEITERFEQLQEEAGKLMMDIENSKNSQNFDSKESSDIEKSREKEHKHSHEHGEKCEKD